MQPLPAILINLDRDADRLAHMQKQLDTAGLSFARQAGFLGKDIPKELRSRFFDAQGNPKTALTDGEIGCYASHLAALSRVADGEFGDAALIMEDDLALAPGFADIVGDCLDNMPDDWGLLRLSNPPRSAYAPLAPVGENRFLVKYSRIPVGSAAYAVSRGGAKTFLAKGFRGLPVDIDFRYPWIHGLKTFGVVAPAAKAGVLASSIDTVGQKRKQAAAPSSVQRLRRGDGAQTFKRIAYNIRDLGFENWLICAGTNLACMVVARSTRRKLIQKAADVLLELRPDPEY
ncbi:MAG: glycosyltransferase family 25 protein [Alphaproteobacteria bacterium]|nr:glycosyltransferase family 25 protein [Alphaproteobacteria bacterium]